MSLTIQNLRIPKVQEVSNNANAEPIPITTGCKKYYRLIRIDEMLHGIEPKDLIQWAGPSSSGKSQLAHLMTLETALHHPGNVLYIDSGGQFDPKRILQLYSHSDRYLSLREKDPTLFGTIRKALKRIILTKCFDHTDLNVILDDLLCNKDISQNISLMIIDSLGCILSPLSTPRGQGDLANSIAKIKEIQKSFDFPIIGINNCVSLGEPDRLICEGSKRTQTKAGLGHAWASVISKSLYFTPSGERLQQRNALLSGGYYDEENVLSFEDSHGTVFPVVECIVERVKGSKVMSTSIYIGKNDIVCP